MDHAQDLENVGLGPARNIGLDRAAGEYVWFVYGDDWLVPGCLPHVVDRLDDTRPDALIVDHVRAHWNNIGTRSAMREVFPDPAFVELAQELVLLRVDVEEDGVGTELAETYGAASLPTLILLEPSGAYVGAASGSAPARELVRGVRAEVAAHQRALAAYERTLAAGDAQALERLALERWHRRDTISLTAWSKPT